MYTIGICDDEPIQVKLLTEYVQELCLKNEIDVKIVQACSGEELVELAKTQELDIVFLDIEMGGIDGLQTGRIIREKLQDAVIIFITGYRDYALESYEIKAFNYIIKPLTRNKFIKVFTDAKKHVDDLRFIEENEKRYNIKHRDGMVSLRYSDIYYLEKDGKNINVCSQQGCYTYRATLKEVLKNIDSEDFIQCHQGYIVNMNKITNRRENALIFDGIDTDIPIGKTYRKAVIDAIERRLLMRW